MDRDRQMSETLGHDTELGDSARDLITWASLSC